MAIEHKVLLKGENIDIEEVIGYCNERYIDYEVLDDESIYLNDLGVWIYFLYNEKKNIGIGADNSDACGRCGNECNSFCGDP